MVNLEKVSEAEKSTCRQVMRSHTLTQMTLAQHCGKQQCSAKDTHKRSDCVCFSVTCLFSHNSEVTPGLQESVLLVSSGGSQSLICPSHRAETMAQAPPHAHLGETQDRKRRAFKWRPSQRRWSSLGLRDRGEERGGRCNRGCGFNLLQNSEGTVHLTVRCHGNQRQRDNGFFWMYLKKKDKWIFYQ